MAPGDGPAAPATDAGAPSPGQLEAERERLLEGIRALGFPACYEVGGCVRDELMGRPPKDIDLMVAGMTYDELFGTCQQVGRCLPLESKGTLIGVRLRADFTSGKDIEIALARTEVSTGDGRHEFEITPLPVPAPLAPLPHRDRRGDPELIEHALIDAGRRDLTVNAIARDVYTGEILDSYGGVDDVRAGRLRVVSEDTFRDDPLRLFRLIARIGKDGSEPDEQTVALVREAAARLNIQDLPPPVGADPNSEPLSQDRVRDELKKSLGFGDDPAPHSARAMRWARDLGLLQAAVPEWSDCVGFKQESKYHDLTVDEHILATLEHADRIGADPRVKLALLFHDMDKPATAKLGADGHLHFYAAGRDDPVWVEVAAAANARLAAGQRLRGIKGEGEGEGATLTSTQVHALAMKDKTPADLRALLPARVFAHEQLAAEHTEQIMGGARLRFDVPTQTTVTHLVRHHMFTEEREFLQKAETKQEIMARRFLARHGQETAFLLCQLRRCDLAGKGPGAADDPETFRDLDAFEAALTANLHQPVTLRQLELDGGDLEQLGLKPGPAHGRILREMLAAVIADPERNDHEWLKAQAAKLVLEATGGEAGAARAVLTAAKAAHKARKEAAREAFIAAGGVIPPGRKPPPAT